MLDFDFSDDAPEPEGGRLSFALGARVVPGVKVSSPSDILIFEVSLLGGGECWLGSVEVELIAQVGRNELEY